MQRKATGSKAGPVGRRERRAFSAEFKAEAVRMMHERRATRVSIAQVPRELDMRAEQLRRWAQEAKAERAGVLPGAPGETLEQEKRRLRRENELLRQEHAFAKKVAVYFARESR